MERTLLVGRRQELVALGRLLRRARLVTVVGAPGAGKTALARAFARGRRGAIVCDVAEARSMEDLCVHLSVRLGLAARAGGRRDDDVAAVGAALAARGRVLVVIDDVDAISSACRRAIEAWMEQAGAVRFLVTSRRRLGSGDEQVLELSALSCEPAGRDATSDAARMLIAEVGRLRGRYRPDAVEHERLEAIAKRLDGLPLGLRLAAGRIASVGAAALEPRIAASLDALGALSDGARHTTLRHAVAWSWQMLSDAERHVAAQVAVFCGGVSAESAAAVIETRPGAPDVLDTLASLCDRSLLTSTPGPGGRARFGAYAAVLAFLEERLSAGHGAKARAEARHAAHFAGAARDARLAIGDGAGDDRWLLEERGNVRAAAERLMGAGEPAAAPMLLELAAAQSRVAGAHGGLGEHVAFLDRVLAHPGVRSTGAGVVPVLAARGRFRWRLGDPQHALTDQRDALERASQHYTPGLAASVLGELAVTVSSLGRNDEARELLERALSLHQEAGDVRNEAATAAHLTALLQEQGRHDEARAHLRRALDAAEGRGRGQVDALVLRLLGIALLDDGDAVAARRLLARARDAARAAGDAHQQALVASNLAVLEHDVGRRDRAARGYEHALGLLSAVGSRRLESGTTGYFGLLELERGRPHRASRLLGAAWRGFVDAGDAAYASFFAAAFSLAVAQQGGAAPSGLTAPDAHGDPSASPHPLRVATSALRATEAVVAAGSSDAAWEALFDALGEFTGRSFEARRTLAIAQNLLGDRTEDKKRTRAPRPAVLRIERSGLWFESPRRGRISCAERPTARRLVALLVEERERAPGSPVPFERLFAAAWLGQRVRIDSVKNRLKVLVSTLRSSGLLAIAFDAGGYLLDPRADIEIVAACRLEVDAAGPAWSLVPGSSGSTASRPALASAVLALARSSIESPGRAVPSERLLRSAWPDDVAARGRLESLHLHVLVELLRRRGLAPWIEQRNRGVWLDPSLTIVVR